MRYLPSDYQMSTSGHTSRWVCYSLLAYLCVTTHGAQSHPAKTQDTVSQSHDQKLMVVLLDGFRWDYFTPDLVGFNQLFKTGVKAEFLRPVFPSVSYTNYYSIMTGLYPETHGMVANYMFDAAHNEYFWIGTNPEQSYSYWWDEGDPLWITAERQGKHSYMFYWPGCEADNIRGLKPTFCEPYVGVQGRDNLTWSLATGLELLKNNSADFVGVYYDDPDLTGHIYGPGSEEQIEVVKYIDSQLDWLQQELVSRGLETTVNLMVLSDHGMTQTSANRVINMTQFMDMADLVRVVKGGPLVSIWPQQDKVTKVYNELKDIHPNLTVYLKSELPTRWHYKHHSRVAPLTAVADLGWVLIHPNNTKLYIYPETGRPGLGAHGYDISEKDMATIFFARGPSFKSNFKIPAVNNTELYQVMCHVLNIVSSPHNGSWGQVEAMLSGNSPPLGVTFGLTYVVIGAAFVSAIGSVE